MRVAGTAGPWQCGLKAAAPGRQSAGWRAQWPGSSDNPGTPASPSRCAGTPLTAGAAPARGPGTTPEQRQGETCPEPTSKTDPRLR